MEKMFEPLYTGSDRLQDPQTQKWLKNMYLNLRTRV